jgi:hypothetical protein
VHKAALSSVITATQFRLGPGSLARNKKFAPADERVQVIT